MEYCKRLIEVDLPIKRISAQARREKSVRHGHISTLHIWWARRPLAACRAVLCASLWPDPVDSLCPQKFIDEAKKEMLIWSYDKLNLLSPESFQKFIRYQKNPKLLDNNEELRNALLDFIADYSDWDNACQNDFLRTSRHLTSISNKSLGESPNSKPLVVDPFAGGGSIPIETLRIGADSFASDLNPVPFLLNKVMIEYLPKYGKDLIDEISYASSKLNIELEKELKSYYASESDGSKAVAYLWARKIKCEGPGCGIEIPLLRSQWLNKKSNRSIALYFVVNRKKNKVDIEIIEKKGKKWICTSNDKVIVSNPKFDGTIKRSAAICPNCGYTTSAENVRRQISRVDGGADLSEMYCVIYTKQNQQYKFFRKAEQDDIELFQKAKRILNQNDNYKKLVPSEELPYLRSIFNVNLIGIDKWYKLFNSRQLLSIIVFIQFIKKYKIRKSNSSKEFEDATKTILTFILDRCIDYWSSLAVWANDFIAHTFGRQALGIIWDYAEANPLSGGTGSIESAKEWVIRVLERENISYSSSATVIKGSATKVPLPDKSAQVVFTDPPYYDAVPYADLSDFFYVWMKRVIGENYPSIFDSELSPKTDEIVQLAERNEKYAYKTKENFELLMQNSMLEAKRYLESSGICVVVFAHKTTSGWETQLNAMNKAGWKITSSWPIDTERPGRLRANKSAALASSIHLVCRPRIKETIGDWRDILNQLPKRIHAWMPRLQKEGIVGADAIFACLGPALEIFSQYSKVEKASGEEVTLKDYLEHVWAAVAKEALNMIFEDADASGFEENSRLTAMWLWTLFADKTTNGKSDLSEEEESEDDSEEDTSSKKKKITGYVLEYDAARKIAQGLGIHLENLKSVVDVKGETATLLSVSERARYFFNKEDITILPKKSKRKAQESFDFMKEIEKEESDTAIINELARMNTAETTLDKLHQTMLLFAANRGEAMKRLLVEEGFGRDNNFWKLAQALSALYPAGSDEKRWVDGVLARKKGLGF